MHIGRSKAELKQARRSTAPRLSERTAASHSRLEDVFREQKAELVAMKARNGRLLKRIRNARLREAQANQDKADFLAAVSHELRTPMQAIFGYIELLEREIHGPLSLEQAHHLEQIRLNQQQLMQLLNSVLDIASQDDGGRTPG